MIKKRFALLLVMLLTLTAVTALAADVTRNGISATMTVQWAPDADDRIIVTLTAENVTDEYKAFVKIMQDTPAGFTHVSGEKSKLVEYLGSKGSGEETVSITNVYKRSGVVPSTGDSSRSWLWLLGLGLTAAGLVALTSARRRRVISLLLVVALAGGVMFVQADSSSLVSMLAEFGVVFTHKDYADYFSVTDDFEGTQIKGSVGALRGMLTEQQAISAVHGILQTVAPDVAAQYTLDELADLMTGGTAVRSNALINERAAMMAYNLLSAGGLNTLPADITDAATLMAVLDIGEDMAGEPMQPAHAANCVLLLLDMSLNGWE